MAFRGGDDTTFAADPVGLDISVGPLRLGHFDLRPTIKAAQVRGGWPRQPCHFDPKRKTKLIQIFDERVACIWETTKPRGSVLFKRQRNASTPRSRYDRTPRWNMAHILDGHICPRSPLCIHVSIVSFSQTPWMHSRCSRAKRSNFANLTFSHTSLWRASDDRPRSSPRPSGAEGLGLTNVSQRRWGAAAWTRSSQAAAAAMQQSFSPPRLGAVAISWCAVPM